MGLALATSEERYGSAQLQPHGALQTPVELPRRATMTDMAHHLERYLPTLMAHLTNHASGVQDQEGRADCLARMLREHHTIVRLMDGHGRLVILFMLAVIRLHGAERLNRLRIELVDLEDSVTEYHASFFTHAQITSITHDIITLPYDAHTLIYLNFCSLGASKSAPFRALVRWLRECEHLSHVLLSFTTARAAKSHPRTLQTALTRAHARCVLEKMETPRKDFYTGRLKRRVRIVVRRVPAKVAQEAEAEAEAENETETATEAEAEPEAETKPVMIIRSVGGSTRAVKRTSTLPTKARSSTLPIRRTGADRASNSSSDAESASAIVPAPVPVSVTRRSLPCSCLFARSSHSCFASKASAYRTRA